MDAENTAENEPPEDLESERFPSLAEIDAQQDKVLQQLDELNDKIVKLTDEFRNRLAHERPEADAA